VGVAVVVEQVEQREIAGREHEAVAVHAGGELVEVGFQRLGAAAAVPGLAQEQALAIEGRVAPRHARQLAAGETGQPGEAGHRQAQGHFRVEIQLGIAPRPHAEGGAGGQGVAALGIGRQAVGAGIVC